jgi:aquaporin Z
MDKTLRSYIAEFIGTFTLVFIGTSVATLQGFLDQGPAGWLGVAFAFGFTLMVLVLVIGPVSGCHINPAVTLPMAIAGKLPWSRVPGYIISQCCGAVLASALLLMLMKGTPGYVLADHGLGANGNPVGLATMTLLGWEVALTALFLLTIFCATRDDAPPIAAPLAIGGFLFVAHLIGVPLGDSSLNPARSLGPAVIVGGGALTILWIFIVAPLVGGLIGLGLYRLIHTEPTA